MIAAVKRSAWFLGLASVMLASSTALADIKLEGKWPDATKDKVVSLDVAHMPREDALILWHRGFSTGH